jgi:mono/diheme cytochrome c family protein
VALVGGTLVNTACNGEQPPPAANAPGAPATNTNAAATNAAPGPGGHGTAHTNRLEGADLARAEGLFKANCATCHLGSGKGDPHHKQHDIPDFTNAAWHAKESDTELTGSIANGHGKVMPAFKGKLTSDEIALLLHYIREFPDRAGAAATVETSKPPASKPTPRGSKPKAAEKPAPAKEDHSGHGGHP